jgi:hypothetical protein
LVASNHQVLKVAAVRCHRGIQQITGTDLLFTSELAESVISASALRSAVSSGQEPQNKKLKQYREKVVQAANQSFQICNQFQFPLFNAPDPATGVVRFIALIGSQTNQVAVVGGSIAGRPDATTTNDWIQARCTLSDFWIDNKPAALFGDLRNCSIASLLDKWTEVEAPEGLKRIVEYASCLSGCNFNDTVFVVGRDGDAESLWQDRPSSILNQTLLSHFETLGLGAHSVIYSPPPNSNVNALYGSVVLKVAPVSLVRDEWRVHNTLDPLVNFHNNVPLRRLCSLTDVPFIMVQDSESNMHQVTLRNPVHGQGVECLEYRGIWMEALGQPIKIDSFDQSNVDILYVTCRSVLEFMHLHSYVHCDMKPDNIIDTSNVAENRRFDHAGSFITKSFPPVLCRVLVLSLYSDSNFSLVSGQ